MNKFNQKTKDFFDDMARREKVKKRLVLNRASKTEFEELMKFLDLPKGSSLIELGCGTGRFVLPLLKEGYKVTGVDISKKSLKLLRQRANNYHLNNLTLIENNFQKPIFKEKFDGALCISTFHLLADKEKERIKIFSNLVKAVKKGGVVLVIEPNPFNLLFYPFYFFYSKADWNIEKHFIKSSEGSLRRLFSQLGLLDIKVKRYAFLPSNLANYFPLAEKINKILVKVPVVKRFSAFIFIRGTK